MKIVFSRGYLQDDCSLLQGEGTTQSIIIIIISMIIMLLSGLSVHDVVLVWEISDIINVTQ